MNNIQNFISVYEKHLSNAVQKYPQEYMWSIENVPLVVAKMKVAFLNGTYNKDSRAIKVTCKELGIPYTYKGINDYLGVK